ncbi:MAG: hypothetical protein CMJ18_22505 [Phycisphaeraceae bacterium]|nr:hypothetical protein [Phycisphaeraceae bacterium]
MSETYLTSAKGIRILPGQWRPHYPFEHIVWVSPSWPCQDYVWLDFPEAIWTQRELLFLSHVNPECPTTFTDLPRVPWQSIAGGIAYERRLPNGLKCSGQVTHGGANDVDLQIVLENQGSATVPDIRLQTCAYLRAVDELSERTGANKLVHVPGGGWVAMDDAPEAATDRGGCYIGWPSHIDRDGPAPVDRPVVVCRAREANRFVALTWFDRTLSLQNNCAHPCIHADPAVDELPIGERVVFRGKLIFFEGSLEEFDRTSVRLMSE